MSGKWAVVRVAAALVGAGLGVCAQNAGGARPVSPGLMGGNAPKAELYSEQTVVTVAGTILTTGSLVDEGQRVMTLTLKSQSETLMVQLGPTDFVKAQPVKLAPGDVVMVKGSRMRIREDSVIVAAEVTKGGEVLQLRDPETGQPLWMGPEGGRPGSP